MPSGHDAGSQGIGDSESTDRTIAAIDRWFYNDSGATIAASQAVSFDLSKTPRFTRIRRYTGTIATDGTLIVGVTPEAIPDKTWGRVRVRGEVVCNVATSASAGQVLQAVASPGQLGVQSATFAATHRQIAICATAEASNLATVYVLANGFV